MKVLVLFFCSGATGLIYELLWSKYLSLLLGSTAQAQTVVLAAFMGGLALGNRLFGDRADLLRRPLSTYGFLEVAIGIWGFFFAQLYSGADFIFAALGSGMLGTSWLLVLKAFLSAALLLPPTILMGGTLPLLAAWLCKSSANETSSTKGIALFYAVNSLGAVCGAALAGFYLVTNFGMSASLQLTGALNLLVGLAAFAFGKAEEPLPIRPEQIREAPAPPVASALPPLAYLVAITGAASMGLEVLASRSIGMIVGASLQAFAIVLIAFILGISFGSLVICSSALAVRHPKALVYTSLAGTGLLVGVYVLCIEEWVVLYSQTRGGLALNHMGYLLHQVVAAFISIIVLGLPAALLGAVLPLCMRLATAEGGMVASKVGQLLTWNTIGAVVGSLLTGFVLMPLFGLRTAFAMFALMLLLAVALAARNGEPRLAKFIFGFTICFAVLLGVTGEGWRTIIGMGVFRLRTSTLTRTGAEDRKKNAVVLFYKDGPDATVVVEKSRNPADQQLLLKINGKTDASTHGDLSTQYMLAHVPMMMRPESKEVFVFGFGSGITAGALLGHPVERITIAENCGPVLEASRYFTNWNRNVRDNPRTRILKEDARTVLKLSDHKYDIIVAEPSNPWVAGIGSVFSHEFYEMAADHLKEGGIMAQWFHIYEMNDGIVFLVLRTFADVFPFFEIWDSQSGDIILLGSRRPWISTPAQYQKLFEREQPRKDLAEIALNSPEQMWARQIASQRTASAIPGDGPIQTDEFPVLEYAAPEAFFMGAPSLLLFAYDERTFQFALAAPEKNATLRALPEEVVLRIFSINAPCNLALVKYLESRSKAHRNGTQDWFTEEPLFATMFRPYSSYPEKAPALENMSPAQGDILDGYINLLANRGSWEDNVKKIENGLSRMLADPAQRTRNEMTPSFHAGTAAKYYLVHGRFAEAEAAIQLGLRFDPQDLQLAYLSRLKDAWSPGATSPAASLSASGTNLPFKLQLAPERKERKPLPR